VRRLCWLSAPLCLMLLLVAGDTPAQRPVPASDTLVSSAAAPSAIADDEPITPIPQPPPGDPMKLALGEKLFGDRRLSHDGTPTCASCHDLHTNGADDSRRKTSAGGSTERSMVLSVFNAALNFRPNWEGNYWTLEAQAESSLENSKSPATSVEEVLGKINADLGHAGSLPNNEDQDSKPQSLHRELGRGGGCYMISPRWAACCHTAALGRCSMSSRLCTYVHKRKNYLFAGSDLGGERAAAI
jgi:cytochrome c peroxidase